MSVILSVTIPDKTSFYSLYADGPFSFKTYLAERKVTRIDFPENAVAALYYTYPSYRAACLIRNTRDGTTLLPGLSKKVTVLLNVHASRVDKLRRALSYLKARSEGAYAFDDGFFIRLSFLVERKGTLSYPALACLAGRELPTEGEHIC